ncbi:MFS general substrate transporter [Dichomitus squalens]|uniref:MFS general substrate transporter n=1 Tax=Dichomitus squalens TaxID=114155 RepID=A0A4Q9NGB9_9APHY|nr:MFS general substrate transporter [Dichomitus squalens]TBU60411.1 MFS general substrate transporter [Dichomitus squalens]
MLTDEKTSGIDEIQMVVKDEGSISINPLHTNEEEKRLVRRLDMRLMPVLCTLYLFAYLDRINLGNARLQGLPQNVLHGDPTGVLFDWVNSAFYFSYVLCPVPAALLSKLCPPRRWFGCAALCWGLCSMLMATTFNFSGLLVTRVCLGVFEAALSPCTPLYLSLFYTRDEIGLRIAIYNGVAAVAGAFGGLIAFGNQTARLPIANWKLLFIVEGVPSVLLGFVALALLPNRPEETSMFNAKEREIALERGSRRTRADVGRVLQRKHIIAALIDWKVYAAGVMYFASNTAFGAISAFLPTIITTFGFTNAIAQLLTVPPYAVAAIVLCLLQYYSDKLRNRGAFAIASSMLGAVGYALLLAVPSNIHARYFATFCVTSGTYGMNGAIIAWFVDNLGSETKKATGLPLLQAIGQCGALLGSHMYPLTQGPRYIKGFAVNCGLDLLAALIAAILTICYQRENRRRDIQYGKPDPNALVDTSELADKATDFRYTP